MLDSIGRNPTSPTRRIPKAWSRCAETSRALCYLLLVLMIATSCPLVQETVDTMIKTILTERDVMKMVKVIIDRVESVSNNTIDLSRLIISKSLSKPPEDYHPTPPQAQVALKMRARNPHTAPKMGDRVP